MDRMCYHSCALLYLQSETCPTVVQVWQMETRIQDAGMFCRWDFVPHLTILGKSQTMLRQVWLDFFR